MKATDTRWICHIGLVCALVLFSGCDREPTTQPESPGYEGAQDRQLMLPSAAGTYVSQAEMRAMLGRLTREVAVALGVAGVRSVVYQELLASPYRESKLHFRTFLLGKGSGLLAAMSAVRGGPQGTILSTLDSIIDLEFYMPVPRHWENWHGGTGLIVASALQDDGAIPQAFDLAGREVHLYSAEEPPPTPTLALVPVETDFSKPASAPAPTVEAALSHAGVYMTYARVADDHEGFLHGRPEFEVHAYVQNAAGTFVDVQCAGEQQTGALYYNHDDQRWSGNVLLVFEEGITGDSVEFQMWEDDTGPCKPTGGRPPRTDDPTKQQLAQYAARLLSVIVDAGGEKWVKAAIAAVPLAIDIVTALQKDDLVGVIELEGPNNGCFNATGPSKLQIRKPNGVVAGEVGLDLTFGLRDPICTSPEPLPYGSVTVSGSMEVQPNTFCYYWSSVSSGTPPYTYQWLRNGTTPLGTASDVTVYTESSTFDLVLQVWDNSGRPGSETLRIAVSSGAGPCVL